MREAAACPSVAAHHPERWRGTPNIRIGGPLALEDAINGPPACRAGLNFSKDLLA